MNDDCKDCKQTIANCECHISDKEKNQGLWASVNAGVAISKETLKMNKLEQFEQMLKSHDWTYYMSDDHSRFMAGAESAKKLKAFAVEIDCEAARDMWSLYAYAPLITKGIVQMAYPEGKK